MHRVTFVTPRYGIEVVGGAESGARALATRLVADGWPVQVLTTRARSSVTWADDYDEGTSMIDGVAVHRFGVRRPRDRDFDRFSAQIFGPAAVSEATALDWIDRQGPDSPDLLAAIGDVDEGVLALYPYLYQPTVRGLEVARVPTVLHAAAHDEPPLRLPVFDRLFSGVDGLAHHSHAEQALVAERFPATAARPQTVLGLPVAAGEGDADAARRELGLGDGSFVLYLGRIDRGKGVHDLVRWFERCRNTLGDTRLVLAGPVIHRPAPGDGVVVLGTVSEAHKWGLLAAADVLVNPSPLESFSLVILEAWLAGTPVIVNGRCGPMVDHCRLSGGGLWFAGIADFEEALRRLLADRELAARLAAAGADYVGRIYNWPAVRSRYASLLDRLAS
jgi:glycosyltransferase involved in cell wall biosynthesis